MRYLKIVGFVILILVLGVLARAYFGGTWHIWFPSSSHDSVFEGIPEHVESPALLVFSKTNRFRHKEGIAGGQQALANIAKRNGWSLFATENGAVFNAADLESVKAVVFLNATGDMLSHEQELAFQHWMESGGGWLGIHAAGDGSHSEWTWYMDNFIGAEYVAHIMGPQFQNATVVTEGTEHPVNERMPARWNHEEEWYSWRSSPRKNGFKILATVDENTYTPVRKMLGDELDLTMGDHPIVWANCVNNGRALYSAMGHTAEAFEVPQYLILLEDALNWVMGLSGSECG